MIRTFVPAAALALVAAAAGAQEESASSAPNPVVAIVGDKEVYLSDVEQAARNLPEQYQQMPLQMLFPQLVDRLIDLELLATEAEERDYAERDEVQPLLEQARARVLRDALIGEMVTEATTDEKVEARFEEMKGNEDFAVEEVHARHILLETEEAADEVIAELDDGADFAEVAKESSTGPSAEDGGDLGYFRREQMVPEFAEAAFAMEPGTHSSTPVQSQFGFHVIEVLDKRTTEPTLDESAPEIRQELAQEVVAELVGELRGEVEIERFNMDGTPASEGEGAPPVE